MTGWPLSEHPDAALLAALASEFPAKAPSRIAVAVSGGGDSMALLHMALRAPFGWNVNAVTIDHGLRPEAADEAAKVAAFCIKTGTPHQTLRWQGHLAQGNLMDQARQARFRLIADWCHAQGICDVLLGHTADDNAESFLMNLARQSGIDGLSGMRKTWAENGIAWHRPLLAVTRADLRAYLTRNAVSWIDDPSNDNLRYTRVKARRAMAALAPLGISADTLAATIANLAEARIALDQVCEQVVRDGVSQFGGALALSVDILADLNPEIARRLLSGAIRWMNGAPHAPRGSQVLALQKALLQGKDAQLGGVRFRKAGESWIITREFRSVQGAVPLGQVWDHRWCIKGPANPAHEIRALGAEGLRLCSDWRDFGGRDALQVSPAVWAKDRLIAAPLAGNPGQYRAELTQSFTDFILSH